MEDLDLGVDAGAQRDAQHQLHRRLAPPPAEPVVVLGVELEPQAHALHRQQVGGLGEAREAVVDGHHHVAGAALGIGRAGGVAGGQPGHLELEFGHGAVQLRGAELGAIDKTRDHGGMVARGVARRTRLRLPSATSRTMIAR